MSIYGDPPVVPGLDKLREYMATRDIEVRHDYEPGMETEDGRWIEGEWVIRIAKRKRLDDGSVWVSVMELSEQAVEYAADGVWGLMADVLEERTSTSTNPCTVVSASTTDALKGGQ